MNFHLNFGISLAIVQHELLDKTHVISRRNHRTGMTSCERVRGLRLRRTGNPLVGFFDYGGLEELVTSFGDVFNSLWLKRTRAIGRSKALRLSI